MRDSNYKDWVSLVYEEIDRPSNEEIRELLEVIAPDSEFLTVDSLPGSYSNFTHLVNARTADGSLLQFVLRQYRVSESCARGEKARREFKTFELLQRHGLPAPQPLYLDEYGEVLEDPGIVTSYVTGTQIEAPGDPVQWARALAVMLARIHSIPGETAAGDFLLDANSEATWFLRSGSVPDYMAAHPDGVDVWRAVHDLLPHCKQVEPRLVHIDYWPGNILWDQGQISAIVDWEEAAYGDPGIDVAYCRMEMFLTGMGHVADEFLTAYEVETSRRVANLGFWELAAAARPMIRPEGRIAESPAKEEFRRFIAQAGRRCGYS